MTNDNHVESSKSSSLQNIYSTIAELQGCSTTLEILTEFMIEIVTEICRFFSIVEQGTLTQPCLFHADFNHDFKQSGKPLLRTLYVQRLGINSKIRK